MDELVYGVVRGVDVPEAAGAAADERRLMVFSVDTRTHGAARLLLDLAELDRLDDAELPEDAAVTPLVYALAGPPAAVAAAQEPFAAQLQDAYDQLAAGVAPSEVARGAEARLVGLAALSPERLADLALLELVGGDWIAYPMPAAVILPDGAEVRGVYAAESADDDSWQGLVEALLEAWLRVESVPGRDRPWNRRDLERLLNDPIYAFGVSYEPRADVTAMVDAFTRGLAERPEEWDLAGLEAEYRGLLARLAASQHFRRGPDAPPLIPLAEWLGAQLARIAELRAH
ncbi:MAG TPA: hypothetical protein VK066_27095 [Chloroflexota bacterium]|nr:hypothetical protein [Chloroflexota bacterium]